MAGLCKACCVLLTPPLKEGVHSAAKKLPCLEQMSARSQIWLEKRAHLLLHLPECGYGKVKVPRGVRCGWRTKSSWWLSLWSTAVAPGGGWADAVLTPACYTGIWACWDQGSVAVRAWALLPVPPTGMLTPLLCHHPQRDLRGLSQPCSRLGQVSALQPGWGAAAQPNQPHDPNPRAAACHTHALSQLHALVALRVRSLQRFILVHGLILTLLSHCWVPTTTGMVLQSVARGSSLPSFCTKPELRDTSGHSFSTSHTAQSCRPGL